MLLYDAFQKEARKRRSRSTEEWMLLECLAVWEAARDYAQQHGLRVLTLNEVKQEEGPARGHIDYGAKWAYGVARSMESACESGWCGVLRDADISS